MKKEKTAEQRLREYVLKKYGKNGKTSKNEVICPKKIRV